jgi:hypothetical protein
MWPAVMKRMMNCQCCAELASRMEGREKKESETHETRRGPDVSPSEDDGHVRPQPPDSESSGDGSGDVESDSALVDGANVLERRELRTSFEVRGDGFRFEAAVR